MPHRPSELWSLKAQGYSDGQCLDFDFAVVDFWEWFDSKRNEKIQIRESQDPHKLKKKHIWTERYTSEKEILALYRRLERGGAGAHLDPIVATMTGEDVDIFLDEWESGGEIERTEGDS